jgi:hypothetical protein
VQTHANSQTERICNHLGGLDPDSNQNVCSVWSRRRRASKQRRGK